MPQAQRVSEFVDCEVCNAGAIEAFSFGLLRTWIPWFLGRAIEVDVGTGSRLRSKRTVGRRYRISLNAGFQVDLAARHIQFSVAGSQANFWTS